MNSQSNPIPKSTMVFACSGAADVGAVSDQSARRFAREQSIPMCCTAAVGAKIPEILEKVQTMEQLVVFDGCSKDCAKQILNLAGFSNINHVQLEALGLKKGETPITDENVEMVCNITKEYLRE